MIAKSARGVYGLKQDGGGAFEFYLYCEPSKSLHVVFDLFLERAGGGYESRKMQSVGWIFAPIWCL